MFSLEGVEGLVTVIAPEKPAAGNPWISVAISRMVILL